MGSIEMKGSIGKKIVYWFIREPFKRQPRKMVKHTETIRGQIADELFEFVWPFCGIVA